MFPSSDLPCKRIQLKLSENDVKKQGTVPGKTEKKSCDSQLFLIIIRSVQPLP